MFEFAWPWMFALLPLPWLLRRVLPPADSGEAALHISFLEELESLSGQRAHLRLPAWRRQARFIVIWLLLLCAAARPQWLGEPLPVPSSGRDMLLAIDVSGSMSYSDMQLDEQPLSRLDAVKQLFGDFIETRHGDRLGLILFGTEPYLQSPLTFDRRTVRIWLDEAQVGIAGTYTALGDAIGLAIKQLLLRPAKSRVLVLITDGASNGGALTPELASALAAQEQVRIYTIGIGADADQGLSRMFGLAPALDLDEASLQYIAQTTGGQYFRAQNLADLKQIKDSLDALEPVPQQAQIARAEHALYVWPLTLALLGALLLSLENHNRPSLGPLKRWLARRSQP